MNERVIRKVIAGEEMKKGDAIVIHEGKVYKLIASTINPGNIPELADDLACYWCGGEHEEGEVCRYAPYYIETKGDNEHDD